MFKNLQAPLFVCIDATYRCNLSCKHCFFINDDNINNDSVDSELTIDEIKRILDDCEKNNVLSVQFAGGEPFCRNDFVDIIEYASEKRFLKSIATNALLIDDYIIKIIKKSNINNVQISLDGSCLYLHEFIRGKNTFDNTIMIIKKLLNEKINVSIAYTLNKINVFDIDSIINFLINIGVSCIRFQILINYGNANKNFLDLSIDKIELKNIFYNIYNNKFVRQKKIKIDVPCTVGFLNKDKNFVKNVGCGAGTTHININPYGYISACAVLTGREWAVGNVRNDNLFDIWNSNLFDIWRCQNIEGKCSKCDSIDYCKGGCRANALMYNNSFFSEDPLCWV